MNRYPGFYLFVLLSLMKKFFIWKIISFPPFPFKLQPLRFQKRLNHFIRRRRVVMYINPMPRVGLDIRFEIARGHQGEIRGRGGGDRRDGGDAGGEAVAAAVGEVVCWDECYVSGWDVFKEE